MTPSEVVAANITRLREQSDRWGGRELSQAALARRCGWSPNKIGDLEHRRDRKRATTPDELFVLCRALEVQLFDLLLPPPGVGAIDDPEPVGPVSPSIEGRDYVWFLFGMSPEQASPDERWRRWGSGASSEVRRQILAMHPSVDARAGWLIDEWFRHYRVLLRALVKAGHHTITLQSNDGALERLSSDDALEYLDATDPLERDQAPMTLTSAWKEEKRLAELVEKTIDAAVALLEREIASSPGLPDPPEIDALKIHGEPLPESWLERAAYPWLQRVVSDGEWLKDFAEEHGIAEEQRGEA